MQKKPKTTTFVSESPRFSRRWWLAAARNFIWVVVVTVLIWVYADMEFTDTVDVRATIRLTTARDGTVTLQSGDRDVEISVKLQGNRSGLAAFQRWLREHGSVLTYDVSEQFGPNDKPWSPSTISILNKVADLSGRGLTAVTADPGAITFRLDRLIRVSDIPVVFEYTGAQLAAPPVIKPSKMAIHVGETAWKAARAAMPLEELKLRTKPIDLKNISPEEPVIAEVIPYISLGNKDRLAVKPEADAVKVELQVQQRIETKPFNVTPRVMLPATWQEDSTWADYKLVRRPNETWTKEIKVQGPRTDLDSLNNEDIDAYVVLREDDKKPVESWLTREVMVRFPSKLHVELAGEKPTVSFKLEKRP